MEGHAATSPTVIIPVPLFFDPAFFDPARFDTGTVGLNVALHGHNATSPQVGGVDIEGQSAAHIQTATSPALTTFSQVLAQSAVQVQTATSPTLFIGNADLFPANAVHGHRATRSKVRLPGTKSVKVTAAFIRN